MRYFAMIMSMLLLAGCDAGSFNNKNAAQASQRSASPLQQVWLAEPDLATAQHDVSVEQMVDNAENPSSSRVTVLQSGLLDDSVLAQRTVYVFKKDSANNWLLKETTQEYDCARHTERSFQTELCP